MAQNQTYAEYVIASLKSGLFRFWQKRASPKKSGLLVFATKDLAKNPDFERTSVNRIIRYFLRLYIKKKTGKVPNVVNLIKFRSVDYFRLRYSRSKSSFY